MTKFLQKVPIINLAFVDNAMAPEEIQNGEQRPS